MIKRAILGCERSYESSYLKEQARKKQRELTSKVKKFNNLLRMQSAVGEEEDQDSSQQKTVKNQILSAVHPVKVRIGSRDDSPFKLTR